MVAVLDDVVTGMVPFAGSQPGAEEEPEEPDAPDEEETLQAEEEQEQLRLDGEDE